MTTRLRNSFLLIIAVVFGAQSLEARRFEAVLPEIVSAGFYRVQLSPHVSAVAGADFSSLRLRSGNGQEQPYLVQKFPQKGAARLGLPIEMERITAGKIAQSDSGDKRSYIRVQLEEPFYIDELRLDFTGPRFYSRIVRMPESIPDWQQRFNQERELVIGKSVRGRELLLVIENDDNPALRLQNITISQQSQFLTAWLERGRYVLEYGDFAAVAPRYDITVLRDTLSNIALPLLKAGPPELLPERGSTVVKSLEQASKPASREIPSLSFLMWSVIGAILVGLVIATRALARKIGSGGGEVE